MAFLMSNRTVILHSPSVLRWSEPPYLPLLPVPAIEHCRA